MFHIKISEHREFIKPENIDCGCFFRKFDLSKEKVNAILQVVTSSLVNILRKRIDSMDIKFEKQISQFPQGLQEFFLESKESIKQEMWSSIENDMESTKKNCMIFTVKLLSYKNTNSNFLIKRKVMIFISLFY